MKRLKLRRAEVRLLFRRWVLGLRLAAVLENFPELAKKEQAKRDSPSREMARRMRRRLRHQRPRRRTFVRRVRRARDIRIGRRNAVAEAVTGAAAVVAEIAADGIDLADAADGTARADVVEAAAGADAAGLRVLVANFPRRNTRQRLRRIRRMLRRVKRRDRKDTFRRCCRASLWRNSGRSRRDRNCLRTAKRTPSRRANRLAVKSQGTTQDTSRGTKARKIFRRLRTRDWIRRRGRATARRRCWLRLDLLKRR